jgi:hypothetical protein
MTSYYNYNMANAVSDRVASAMAAIREAERAAAQYCGMAFDGGSAEEIYRNALEHCGVPRSDTAGLSASELRTVLKHRPTLGSQAWRSSPAMAQDSKTPSVLDSILGGIKPPRDSTTRNDLRR